MASPNSNSANTAPGKGLPRELRVLGILGGLFFLFVLIGYFVWPKTRMYYVPSGSMLPTINVGDRLMVTETAYRSANPHDGEIAIFKAPRAALLNQDVGNQDVVFIKRVVGTPGQVVEMRKSKLFVDNKPVAEPYVLWDDDYSYDMKIGGSTIYCREYEGGQASPWMANGIIVEEAKQIQIGKAKPGKVPFNSYLMLGDHRSNSNDSHVWGFAPRDSFRGRVNEIFWPASHWRSFQ